MSLKETILRHRHIIYRIQKSNCTFKDILNFLERKSEEEDYDFQISKRTFERDRIDIYELYHIDIQYDTHRKVYYIDASDEPQLQNRIIEAFDTFHALKATENLSKHIHFENRKPQGTENLHGFLHAIKNNLVVKFFHLKFGETEYTERIIEPYSLKEFKNRWYILAKDVSDNKTKTFGLDRISDVEITNKKYPKQSSKFAETYFEHSFGIIASENSNPETIILSFDAYQGKYIKSLPLHHSQTVLKDSEVELQIELKLHITHDFVMEILSFGETVKVLSPEILVDEIKNTLSKSIKKYVK